MIVLPFPPHRLLVPALAFLTAFSTAQAAVSPSGLNRSRYSGSVSITATGTSATVDGVAFPTGIATAVSNIGYHELTVVDGAATTYAFIVRNPERGSTEDGLPTMRPYRLVNDAPSAFAGAELTVMVPSSYPQNLPIPVALRLSKGAAAGAAAGDPLFLNGIVRAGNYAANPVQMRRGWGSTILPAATTAGARDFNAALHSLTDTAPVTIEPTTTWTTKGGDVAGAEDWGADARIFLTSTLKLAAGASLHVGPGTIVRCAPGVEIWVRPGAFVQIDGTVANPAVFVPDNTNQLWGGFWLQPQSGANIARLTATGTIFCAWGADANWFTTPSGEPARTFPHHRSQQPCVAVAAGAVCDMTDCALVGPTGLSQTRGAAFAANAGRLLLTRTLVQRCITGGEQENCPEFEVHSSAFLEFTEPGVDVDGDTFADADNDALYLVPRPGNTYHISKCAIGWTKDDGIDTGGDGAGTVIVTGSWFENCIHEGISNSGVGRVPQMIGGVMLNNGQGMECGYGGPHSLVKDSAVIGNMVGARYGDNYGSNSGSNGSGTSQYDGDIAVENSLCLYNEFHDTWAIDFSRWTYSNNKLTLKDSKVSRAGDLAVQNGAEDSGNALWNPATDGAELAPFMPVPGSEVGVDFTAAVRQGTIPDYPGSVQVRLSTFSSHTVSTAWKLAGRSTPESADEAVIASGVLTWLPGQTLQTVSAPIPAGSDYGLVTMSLTDPVNAAVTGGPLWFFAAGEAPPAETLVAQKSSGWSYFSLVPANPADHNTPWPPLDTAGASWTSPDFILSSSWNTGKTAPIGWGTVTGATLATTITERPVTSYYRKTFTVSDPAQVRGLVLESMADDGAAVYLNGVRVSPTVWGLDPGTTPGGAIYYDTLSSRYNNGSTEGSYYSETLTGGAVPVLHAAPALNVLAIEVHQESTGSSDCAMDASLTATLGSASAGGWGVTQADGGLFLYWTDSAWMPETSGSLEAGSWIPRPDLPSPLRIAGDERRMFFRLRQ